jgi:hypothetical protein
MKAHYFAGILGGRLMSYFITRFYDQTNDAFPQIKVGQLKSLPIRPINFADPADKARHDRMVQLVEGMLDLHKRKAAARTQIEQDMFRDQIERTDRQIDALVYELYGLTPDEIAIVEEATRAK